jgi:hypothetical protein
MEVFATFGLIMLVTMAIPIALLFSALVFDLAVIIYVGIASIGTLKRKLEMSGRAALSSGKRKSRPTDVVWAH